MSKEVIKKCVFKKKSVLSPSKTLILTKKVKIFIEFWLFLITFHSFAPLTYIFHSFASLTYIFQSPATWAGSFEAKNKGECNCLF